MTGEKQSSVPWRPNNPAESQLLAALDRDDRQEFFKTLTTIPLFVPQLVPDPTAATTAEAENLLTYTIGDETYLLVFTSVAALRGSVGEVANGYVETDYAELREKLPEGGVRLGFNLGTPIDAWLDVESVAKAAAGQLDVPTGPEMAGLLEVRDPANAPAVEDAVEQELVNYVGDYIDGLLAGDVLVSTRSAVPGPSGTLPANFPWLIKEVDGARTIEVFSSPELAPAGGYTATVPFAALVKAWPDTEVQLSINPGTPLAFVMPGEVIDAFAASAPSVP